jgi:hypothetical protein
MTKKETYYIILCLKMSRAHNKERIVKAGREKCKIIYKDKAITIK